MPRPASTRRRRILLGAGALVGTVLGGVLLAAGGLALWMHTHKAQWLQATVSRVNEQLAVPLNVQGADLDAWSHFPRIALRLDGVWCPEVLPKNSADTLFYLERAYVQFNAWDLLNGRAVVERIHVQNGRAKIRRYADGTDNYHFWKPSTGPNPQVDLHRIRLEGIALRVESEGAFAQECLLREGTLRGNLSPTGFQAQAEWDLEIPRWGGRIRRPLPSTGSIVLEQKGDLLELHSGTFTLGPWELSATGTARPNDLAWKATANGLDIAALAELLPPEWLPDPRTVQATGRLDLTARGRTLPQGTRVIATARWHEGTLELPASGWKLNQTNATLTWDNGPAGAWTDAHLRIRFTSDAADGTASVRNFESPQCAAKLHVHLPLQTALAWGGFRTVQESSGQVTGTVEINKDFPSWAAASQTGMDGARVSGTLSVQKARALLHGTGLPLEQLSAELQLQSPHAQVAVCSFRVGQTDVRLTGTLENALDWGGTAPLFLDLRATSRRVELQNLLDWAVWEVSEPPLPPGREPEPETPWDYRLAFFADQMAYRSFRAARAQGVLLTRGDRLEGSELRLQTAGGTASGSFVFSPQGSGSVLQAQAQARSIQLKTLLREWENFGQTQLTHQNVDGTAQLDVVCSVPLDAQGAPQPAQSQAVVDFTLAQGKLTGYAPLQALSKYADAEALQNLSFGTLTNTLTWKDGVLTVPPMAVDNNALSLKLHGTHRLNNTVDYTVQFRLKEALEAKKTRRPKEWQAYIEEASDPGKVWIPVRITGPTDQLKITLDRTTAAKSSSQAVQADFKKQGKELRQLLQPAPPAAPKREKYIFEWEEAPDTNRVPQSRSVHSLRPQEHSVKNAGL